ncbi:MAG: nucleotidyltransferase family protein [Symploca sp. SIO3E6]|nr:nucleotidyltransferase family protein [Caldora sp. SIO3E6]
MIAELQNLVAERIKASPAQITDFCQRWNIIEFAIFGSVLREDFHSDSDIDVLVAFPTEHHLTLDTLLTMQEEIETLFGRKVDLVNKKYLKNPYRRHEILSTHEVVYAVE